MVSTRLPTSKSSSAFSNPFVTVPNAPITIGIIVTCMFHSFFNSLARSRYLSFFSHSFSIIIIIIIVPLANAPAQAETLLHSMERAAECIGLHVNAHKTEYMYFNQTGDISILNDSSLKPVDKFTYLGSSVSSTQTDINMRLEKHGQLLIDYQSYGSHT